MKVLIDENHKSSNLAPHDKRSQYRWTVGDAGLQKDNAGKVIRMVD